MMATLVAAAIVAAPISMTIPQQTYVEDRKAWHAYVITETHAFGASVKERDCRRGYGTLYLHPYGKADIVGSITWSHGNPLPLAVMLCSNIPDRSVFSM